MLKRIDARKLLNIEPLQIHDNFKGMFELVCDDGSIKVSGKELWLSRYCWRIHKEFPFIPLRTCHTVTHHIKNGYLTSSTHVKTLEAITDDFFEHYPGVVSHEDRHTLLRLVQATTSVIYNDSLEITAHCIGTIDMTDLVQIIHDDTVKKIREEGDYSPTGIHDVKAAILSHIKTDPKFKTNGVVRSLNMGLIKAAQLLQSIGPWGYPTDVDSFPLGEPITRGYAQGLISMYDNLAESRTASLALHFTEAPLQQAEYFSRKSQFSAFGVESVDVVNADCGSPQLHYRTIHDEKDIAVMDGVYIQDPDTKKLRALDMRKDSYLIGRTVGMRAPFYCHHAEYGKICATCVGKISRNFIDNFNAGQQATAETNQEKAQRTLSTKHFIESGMATCITLNDINKDYFVLSKDGMGFIFKPQHHDKNITLMISSRELSNLSDIFNVDDVENLTPDRMSRIANVHISLKDKEGNGVSELVPLTFQSRQMFLTTEMLKFLRDNPQNWSHQNEYYTIEMTGFDLNKEVFRIPIRQYSMTSNSHDMKAFIESSSKHIAEREDNLNVSEMFEKFLEISHAKGNMHISALGIMFYSNMVTSIRRSMSALPRYDTNKALGIFSNTIRGRSLGAALAYQGHSRLLLRPQIYLNQFKNRPDHPMDWFLLPGEVVKNKPIKFVKGSRVMY